MIIKKIKLIFCVLLLPLLLSAQNDKIKYSLSISTLASDGEFAPFWLQSLDYGKVFSTPNTSFASATLFKEYGDKRRIFDYAFKADFLVRSDLEIKGIYVPMKNDFYFHEIYAKARIFGFNMIAGSMEEIIGNQDSTLSSGGFIFSKNARPIPKVTIGFTDFVALPGSGNLFFIKGAISHGQLLENAKATDALLHHKYLYLRIHGSEFPFWVEGGVDHFAQWGGTFPRYGKMTVNLTNYIKMFFGKQGGSDAYLTDQINALGNHVISQSVKGGVNLGNYKLTAYWQNLSEDGPLKIFWGSMNKEDGLFGFSVKNKKMPFIQGFLYEFFNSTDQSGPFHDKDGMIYGGTDHYFQGDYGGWAYYGKTIGTPLISSPLYFSEKNFRIVNSVVQAHHFGIEGGTGGFDYKLLATFSKNYGNPTALYTTMRSNSSLLFELNKKFGKQQTLETKLSLGADFGEMYGKNLGVLFTIKKSGDLFKLKPPKFLASPYAD